MIRIGPLCLLWNYQSRGPSGARGWGIVMERGGCGVLYVGGTQLHFHAVGWLLAIGFPLERWTPWYVTKEGRRRCAFGLFALSRAA